MREINEGDERASPFADTLSISGARLFCEVEGRRYTREDCGSVAALWRGLFHEARAHISRLAVQNRWHVCLVKRLVVGVDFQVRNSKHVLVWLWFRRSDDLLQSRSWWLVGIAFLASDVLSHADESPSQRLRRFLACFVHELGLSQPFLFILGRFQQLPHSALNPRQLISAMAITKESVGTIFADILNRLQVTIYDIEDISRVVKTGPLRRSVESTSGHVAEDRQFIERRITTHVDFGHPLNLCHLGIHLSLAHIVSAA